MKLIIDIPKEFETDYKGDKFKIDDEEFEIG